MFKPGDIVKTKYESGGGSFLVVEILSDTHMLVETTDPDFPQFKMAVEIKSWDIDTIQYRKTKVTKILNNIKQ